MANSMEPMGKANVIVTASESYYTKEPNDIYDTIGTVWHDIAMEMNCLDPLFYTAEILEDILVKITRWDELRRNDDIIVSSMVIEEFNTENAPELDMKRRGQFGRFRELLESAIDMIVERSKSNNAWLNGDSLEMIRKCAEFIDENVKLK